MIPNIMKNATHPITIPTIIPVFDFYSDPFVNGTSSTYTPTELAIIGIPNSLLTIVEEIV